MRREASRRLHPLSRGRRLCGQGWNGRTRTWFARRSTNGMRLEHRNWGSSQRERSWLVGPVDFPHGNSRGAELLLEKRLEIGAGPRPAAEDVQAQGSVFGKRVAGRMRFRAQAQPADAARGRELMPVSFAKRREFNLPAQGPEQFFH